MAAAALLETPSMPGSTGSDGEALSGDVKFSVASNWRWLDGVVGRVAPMGAPTKLPATVSRAAALLC